MRDITNALLLALVLAGCQPAHEQKAHEGEAHQIKALMQGMFDRPEQPLNADPIIVSGEWAVADWTQGDAGGRALLQRRNDAWRLVLCAGDGLKNAETLVSMGVPVADARVLSADLRAAEASIAPERLAAMAQFANVVRMDHAGHQ